MCSPISSASLPPHNPSNGPLNAVPGAIEQCFALIHPPINLISNALKYEYKRKVQKPFLVIFESSTLIYFSSFSPLPLFTPTHSDKTLVPPAPRYLPSWGSKNKLGTLRTVLYSDLLCVFQNQSQRPIDFFPRIMNKPFVFALILVVIARHILRPSSTPASLITQSPRRTFDGQWSFVARSQCHAARLLNGAPKHSHASRPPTTLLVCVRTSISFLSGTPHPCLHLENTQFPRYSPRTPYRTRKKKSPLRLTGERCSRY